MEPERRKMEDNGAWSPTGWEYQWKWLISRNNPGTFVHKNFYYLMLHFRCASLRKNLPPLPHSFSKLCFRLSLGPLALWRSDKIGEVPSVVRRYPERQFRGENGQNMEWSRAQQRQGLRICTQDSLRNTDFLSAHGMNFWSQNNSPGCRPPPT